MNIQLHHQVFEMSAQLKTVGDLLAQVETKQGSLLNALLHLPDENATPASPPDRYDRSGEAYLERLISGGGVYT
jgi:hypothetical protein